MFSTGCVVRAGVGAAGVVVIEQYAFPEQRYPFTPGMTLRDYFASAAMQGMVASPTIPWTYQEVAKNAYVQADGMLAERNKPAAPTLSDKK
jgi:hypothetical protein